MWLVLSLCRSTRLVPGTWSTRSYAPVTWSTNKEVCRQYSVYDGISLPVLSQQQNIVSGTQAMTVIVGVLGLQWWIVGSTVLTNDLQWWYKRL